MEEAAAHNGSAAGAGTGSPAAARPPATPEGMALAYGSLVLMALLPIFFGALRSVSCAKSKVPPRPPGRPGLPRRGSRPRCNRGRRGVQAPPSPNPCPAAAAVPRPSRETFRGLQASPAPGPLGCPVP